MTPILYYWRGRLRGSNIIQKNHLSTSIVEASKHFWCFGFGIESDDVFDVLRVWTPIKSLQIIASKNEDVSLPRNIGEENDALGISGFQ